MLESEKTTDRKSTPTNPRASWPAAIQEEFEANVFNGCVGTVLVSETDRVRVWHLSISPGQRCNFHRHVLDYFWTVHSSGRALNYVGDGRIVEVEYRKGETSHLSFGEGEFMVHAVENIGDSELLFTTVEFLDSLNQPLPVPEDMRLKLPA